MKKCLYTIHFGDHDKPHEPFKSEGWDYLMFTNRTDIKSNVWDIRVVTTPLPDYLAARYVYINSHLFVPKEYDYSLMIGGQIHVDGDLNKLDIDYGKDFNMMKHPCRTCIYEEAKIIEKEGIDNSLNFIPQMARYRAEGFPENYGLNACGIIGRHNNVTMEDFEREWWHQVMTGSYRDQLSFDYVRWKLDNIRVEISLGRTIKAPAESLTVHNFATPYWDLLQGDIFSVYKHGTNDKA